MSEFDLPDGFALELGLMILSHLPIRDVFRLRAVSSEMPKNLKRLLDSEEAQKDALKRWNSHADGDVWNHDATSRMDNVQQSLDGLSRGIAQLGIASASLSAQHQLQLLRFNRQMSSSIQQMKGCLNGAEQWSQIAEHETREQTARQHAVGFPLACRVRETQYPGISRDAMTLPLQPILKGKFFLYEAGDYCDPALNNRQVIYLYDIYGDAHFRVNGRHDVEPEYMSLSNRMVCIVYEDGYEVCLLDNINMSRCDFHDDEILSLRNIHVLKWKKDTGPLAFRFDFDTSFSTRLALATDQYTLAILYTHPRDRSPHILVHKYPDTAIHVKLRWTPARAAEWWLDMALGLQISESRRMMHIVVVRRHSRSYQYVLSVEKFDFTGRHISHWSARYRIEPGNEWYSESSDKRVFIASTGGDETLLKVTGPQRHALLVNFEEEILKSIMKKDLPVARWKERSYALTYDCETVECSGIPPGYDIVAGEEVMISWWNGKLNGSFTVWAFDTRILSEAMNVSEERLRELKRQFQFERAQPICNGPQPGFDVRVVSDRQEKHQILNGFEAFPTFKYTGKWPKYSEDSSGDWLVPAPSDQRQIHWALR